MESKISKRELGTIGTIAALIQLGIGLASSRTVTYEFSKTRDDFNQLRLEREQYFVRKSDFESLSTKLDQVKAQTTEINIQVASLKTFMRARYGYNSASSTEKNKLHLISWDTREWNSRKKD